MVELSQRVPPARESIELSWESLVFVMLLEKKGDGIVSP